MIFGNIFNKSQWADGNRGTFTHPPTQVTPRHKIIQQKTLPNS